MKKEYSNNNQPFHYFLLKLVLTSFFVVSIFPAISAVQLSMNPNFYQGQTLLAVVSGNFIDQITPNNVAFYRGHTQIPIIDGVVNINGNFYIYALLTGKTQGDYSINISGVRYMKATQVVSDPIVSNFSITNETADFSIDPGAVFSQNNFSVKLTNLLDQEITVNYGVLENTSGSDSSGFFSSLFGSGASNTSSITNSSSVNLNSGQQVTLPFNNEQFSENGLIFLGFSSGNYEYDIPVYLNTNVTTSTNEGTGLEFQPSSVYAPMATNSSSQGIVYLKNSWNQEVDSISFNISSALQPYVSINPTTIATLNPGNSTQVIIYFTSDSNEKLIEGNITAYSGNISSNLNLNLNFTPNFVPSNETAGNQTIFASCADLNGTICASNEQCTGSTESAEDGICCMASCEVLQTSSLGSIIGWGILVVVIILVFWFYKKKYKKVAVKKPF